MNPHDEIAKHFRLSPIQLAALRRLHLRTIGDLLYHFPTRYEEAGAEGQVHALVPKSKVTLIGTLSKLEAKKLWKSRRTATQGWFEDATGRVKVLWFNQPYIAKMAPQDTPVRLTATVGGSAEKPYLINPEITPVDPAETANSLFSTEGAAGTKRLFPVYPESAGITSKWFFHALSRVFEHDVHVQFQDPIPEETLERLHLPDVASALLWIHVPEKLSHTQAARKRFAFEEMLALHVHKAQERARNDAAPSFPMPDAAQQARKFLDSLPLKPTGAQERAVREILEGLTSAHPMARLVEGDVGSGKTLVAATAAYAVVTARPPSRTSGTLQAAYMAPTEILAQQHFASFIEYFRGLPVSIGLLTGSGCKKFPSKTVRQKDGSPGATTISRAQLLKWVESGEIALLIGTHALIQKGVRFRHLALAIVDEQHRFGTEQRRTLARKGDAAPHFLSMTATPIPRTLALTIYGDLDLSVIDELPPGRKKVVTELITDKERERMYAHIRTELAAGRQAYVICPRIEEPDPQKLNALMAKSAKAEAKRLQKDVFPEFSVGLLHGAQTPTEKVIAMRDLENGKTQVLVATSVVEVGVNVPNATVIAIEGAERFGLSQLHQLRGRVQRSSHQPYCYLLPDTKSQLSLKRLRALVRSSDGFELAEADLELRGAGDLYGRSQWGVSDIGMEALKNPRLIEAARAEAKRLVAQDATLQRLPQLARRAQSAAEVLHGE